MSQHARLSASSAHRWMACPGSLALEESLPKGQREQSSKYADEGTAAHELASLALEKNESCAVVVATNDHPAWTLEMARDVQPYVDLVREMATGHALFIEQRVDYSIAIGVRDSFGTADAIILTSDNTELMIVDLKFGRGVEVSAEENEQLMLYALGAIETYDTIIEKDKLKRIRLVISQPRLGAVSEWDCGMGYLEAFRQDAAKAASKTIEGGTIYNPGEDQCRFCKAAGICPALANKIEEVIDVAFDNLDEPLPIPTDNRLLALKMSAIGMIEDWCTAIRAAVEAQLIQGQAVPGYKLVQGKMGNRKWSDEREVEKLFKSWDLKSEDIYDMTLISPTVAEKLLKKTSTRWKVLVDLITRTEGKPSVALESDRRPALSVTPVSEDFEALDDGRQDAFRND